MHTAETGTQVPTAVRQQDTQGKLDPWTPTEGQLNLRRSVPVEVPPQHDSYDSHTSDTTLDAHTRATTLEHSLMYTVVYPRLPKIHPRQHSAIFPPCHHVPGSVSLEHSSMSPVFVPLDAAYPRSLPLRAAIDEAIDERWSMGYPALPSPMNDERQPGPPLSPVTRSALLISP